MMRCACGLLVLFVSLVPRPAAAFTQKLAWDYAGQAAVFYVDQCRLVRQQCTMGFAVGVPGTTRSLEIGSLRDGERYCWEVRLTSGQRSNRVCSP